MRQSAAEALSDIGDAAVEPLIEVLETGLRETQEKAAYAIGNIGDPRAIEPLIKALSIGWKTLQQNAIEALGKIGEPAVWPLIETLSDSDIDVRENAARALSKMFLS